MIKGIGTDILEVKRMRQVIKRRGVFFLNKIFTKKEIEYCEKKQNSYISYAARFAAKEAVVKSLGTGFGKEISFQDIEIINDEKGKPEVFLSERAKKYFNNPKILLSISHSEENAIAFAIFSFSN